MWRKPIPPSREVRAVMVYDRISNAPRPYIRIIAVAFTALFLGAAGSIYTVLAFENLHVHFSDTLTNSLAFTFTLLWALGASIITRPRPKRRNATSNPREWPVLRLITLATQPLWPIAWLLTIATTWQIPTDIAWMLALLGTPAALLLASKYAAWTADHNASAGLIFAAFLTALLFTCVAYAMLFEQSTFPAFWIKVFDFELVHAGGFGYRIRFFSLCVHHPTFMTALIATGASMLALLHVTYGTFWSIRRSHRHDAN